MSRINQFPTTNAHRRRLKPNLFPPTDRTVAEIVPQKAIRQLKA